MASKRPHPEDGNIGNASKHPRSNNGSPEPTAKPKTSIQEQIAAAKARAAAIASQRATANGSPTAASPAITPAPAPASAPTSALSAAEAARARIEAIKARVNAATGTNGTSAPPIRTASPAEQWQPPTPPDEENTYRSRGGLGIGLHPALLAESAQEKARKAQKGQARDGSDLKGKKRLDLSGPSQEELKSNPYYDASIGGAGGAARRSRSIHFNDKGKFIAQAQEIRRKAQVEEMMKRIADTSRKAGLEDEKPEQAFLVTNVPDVEWWDEALLVSAEYPDFDEDAMAAEQQLRIDTEDSVITRYIQHPVLLEPPQDKHIPTAKPMFMTKKEQAKVRRQDRMEKLKEKQAKVRLGLEPPEPPKIKKGNMMRVMGEEAVKDPTAVEAMVNKQIQERADVHFKANEDRKLTKEERNEKLQRNQEHDADKGLYMSVFRVDSLANGKHRYKVDVEAKQRALTGCVVFSPRLNLIIVEGGAYSLRKYRHLLLDRIAWTENAAPTDYSREKQDDRDPANHHAWLRPEDDYGHLKDLSENKCVEIWTGEVRERVFRKFSSKAVETDAEARRTLEKHRCENMWTLAKNYVG